MHIAILHHEVADDASQDDRDVFAQVESVRAALAEQNHTTTIVSCSLNLERLKQDVMRLQPNVVFNLVETLGHSDRLAPLAPLLLEAIGQPYTGASAESLWTTTSKLATKQALLNAGLPTADWLTGGCGRSQVAGHKSQVSSHVSDRSSRVSGHFIIKAVFEHASYGLEDAAVVHVNSEAELRQQLSAVNVRLGRPCFAERYVDGREFNISLLSSACGAEVLPPAEIQFQGFAADRPRIVGYRAKWDTDSREYVGTPRSFTFPAADQRLLEQLRELSLECWSLFGLRGYARVDFRVDTDGQPWILEINANPCLSPDAGFAAALNEAGISFASAIERILDDAVTSKT